MGGTATTATVLFTDLVGSTALHLPLGEQAFEALRHAHDQMVREAIAAHGGTLVKGLGDGLMASFAGAADAVDAAVAVQQAIDVYNRKATSALAVRVGVSAGDVTWEGGDCYGLAVVEASRLCAAADGGAILVSEVVRMMAHGRGGWSFGAVSGLDLKSLTDPLPARSVLWEPLSARASVPLPPRLVTSYQVGLFGRATEQELIARCWQEAKEGQRRVVLLAGEPGIGKTRLATESALAAHADGAILLFGWSDEDLGVPYRPFVEDLRHYVAHAPVDVLQGHVREHKGELARLVPELRQRIPALPSPQAAAAETERYLLFEAVAGLLSAASQQQPLVIVLDDLQWAGTPELLLLKHLVRSTLSMRLLDARRSTTALQGWLKHGNPPGDPSTAPRCGAQTREGRP
jgi:class 3 adenylate cyclase